MDTEPSPVPTFAPSGLDSPQPSLAQASGSMTSSERVGDTTYATSSEGVGDTPYVTSSEGSGVGDTPYVSPHSRQVSLAEYNTQSHHYTAQALRTLKTSQEYKRHTMRCHR